MSMQIERVLTAAAAAFVMLLGSVAAQQPPAAPTQPPAAPTPTPTAPAPAAGGGQGPAQGRGRVATFPAQQRPPGDPALIERGKSLYSSVCSACHGVDARGGQLGGPNLLRSQLVLNDQAGELIMPIVKGCARRARHAADSDAGRGHQGRRGVPAQPAGRRSSAGRTAGERGAVAERARRRRCSRREILCREVQHVSLRDRRSERHRDARARRPDAAAGVGHRVRRRRPRRAGREARHRDDHAAPGGKGRRTPRADRSFPRHGGIARQHACAA